MFGPTAASIRIRTFPAEGRDLGATHRAQFDDAEASHLAVDWMGPFAVTREEVAAFLDRSDGLPLDVDGERYWSTTADPADVGVE